MSAPTECPGCQSPNTFPSYISGTEYQLPCHRCSACNHQFVEPNLFKSIYRKCPKAYIDRTELKPYLHVPKEMFPKRKRPRNWDG